jgi:hypothetical protein
MIIKDSRPKIRGNTITENDGSIKQVSIISSQLIIIVGLYIRDKSHGSIYNNKVKN